MTRYSLNVYTAKSIYNTSRYNMDFDRTCYVVAPNLFYYHGTLQRNYRKMAIILQKELLENDHNFIKEL